MDINQESLKLHYELNGGNTKIMQRLDQLLSDYKNKFND